MLPFLLTGCGSSSADQTGPVSVDSTKILQEYQVEAKGLTLPEGVSFPPGKFPADMVYGPGNGKNQADGFWWCAWSKQYLATDGAARETALTQLATMPEKYVYKVSADADTRKGFDATLAAAKLGDPSKVQADVAANCG